MSQAIEDVHVGGPDMSQATEDVRADGASSSSSSSEEEPDWLEEPEDENARNMVFLITLSALLPSDGTTDLVDPSSLSREDVQKAVLDAVEHPAQECNVRGGRPRTRPLAALKILGAREKHKRGAFHHHLALKLSVDTRFLPLKEALRRRSKLASHWSTTHTQMWSAVRYLTVPSPKKPTVDSEPLAWTSDGSPMNLFEEAQEPYSAKACKRRREAAAHAAVEKGEKQKREQFTKLDFTSLVLAESLTTPDEVMSYVQDKGSVAMQAYVNRVQRRLKEFIDDAGAWQAAKSRVEASKETDWQLVERVAKGTCQCGDGGCEWWAAAADFFDRNPSVNKELLASSLRKVIAQGPSKTTRVPLITGPRNAGKSTVLEPLTELFGPQNVVNKPKLGASCPLGKLAKDGKRFIFFDDFRPVEYASLPKDNPTVAATTFLAMFCGQPFDIQVSQSFHDGHPEMVWRRGAAITAKAEGLWDATKNVPKEEIRHMQARVMEFQAEATLAERNFRVIPKCKESFARWLVVDSVAFAGRLPIQLQENRSRLQVPTLPIEQASQETDS
jgi:hypothetical protein